MVLGTEARASAMPHLSTRSYIIIRCVLRVRSDKEIKAKKGYHALSHSKDVAGP